MNQSQKINRVRELFYKLYCFKSEEIDGFLAGAESFPPNGLDELIKVLEEGKIRQDELLALTLEQDKSFNKKLKSHLKAETTKIKKIYETGEKKEAEDILGQL